VPDTRYDSRMGCIWHVSCEKGGRMRTIDALHKGDFRLYWLLLLENIYRMLLHLNNCLGLGAGIFQSVSVVIQRQFEASPVSGIQWWPFFCCRLLEHQELVLKAISRMMQYLYRPLLCRQYRGSRRESPLAIGGVGFLGFRRSYHT
jgi:hypothetical protein